MKLRIIYEPKGRAGEYAELAANLYRGCGHGCAAKYCYAPGVVHMTREEFQKPKPRKNVLALLEKDAAELEAAGDIRPVMLSFTTDAYQPIEDKEKLTRRGIQILKRHGINVEILTKGGLRATRDFDLLEPRDAFASTLTFCREEDSKQWEPNAATPSDRLAALAIAHGRGLQTWASLEPVIDPAQSLALIEMTAKAGTVDLYKLGAWNYDKRAKAIDWVRYFHHAIAIVKHYEKDFIIKHDLRKLAGVDEGGEPI